jgi:hypothetical protein
MLSRVDSDIIRKYITKPLGAIPTSIENELYLRGKFTLEYLKDHPQVKAPASKAYAQAIVDQATWPTAYCCMQSYTYIIDHKCSICGYEFPPLDD